MNKTLKYYMSLPYRMEIIPDTEEGGFTAWYPELPGCLTCGDTLEETVTLALDAKKCWLEAAIKDGWKIEEPFCDATMEQYSGQFKLRIPKTLHYSLAKHAKEEGISMNQYCLYLLARNDSLFPVTDKRS